MYPQARRKRGPGELEPSTPHLLPIDNYIEKKKIVKKYKIVQISRHLQVVLLLSTICNAEN